MRHLPVVVGAAALFVLVAGCSSAGTTGAGGGGVLSTTSAHAPSSVVMAPGPAMPGVHLPPGAVPVPGSQVNASALPVGYPREVWTEQGGMVLGVDAEQGGCFNSTAVLTQQTAAEVTVRLTQGSIGAQAKACPMYLTYKPVTVHLAAPLGQRTVVLQLLKGPTR